jgi:hypothetical protein
MNCEQSAAGIALAKGGGGGGLLVGKFEFEEAGILSVKEWGR